MTSITRAWKGDEKLWIVFWLYGMLAGTILNILFIDVIGGFVPLLGIIWPIVFTIWYLVASWRCAFNVNWRPWGYIVRILNVMIIVLIPIGMLLGLLGSDLMKAAECRKKAEAYIAQGGTDIEKFKRQCLEEQISASNNSINIAAEHEAYYKQCLQMMTDAAVKNKANPNYYISQNQDYLKQCVEYYIKNDVK